MLRHLREERRDPRTAFGQARHAFSRAKVPIARRSDKDDDHVQRRDRRATHISEEQECSSQLTGVHVNPVVPASSG